MITLRLASRAGPADLRIVYSGLSEAAISLHVLSDPKHHPLHAGWVRRCRSLASTLRIGIRELRPIFAPGLMGFLAPQTALPTTDPDGELDRLLGTPPETLFYELSYRHHVTVDAHSPGDTIGRAPLIIDRAASRPDEQRLLEEAIERPDALLERLANLLSAYWDHAFGEEWSRVRHIVDRAAEKTARLVQSDGLVGLMQTLAPAVKTSIDGGTAELPREWESTRTIRQEDLLLLHVSYYLWPHVWVSVDPFWPATIVIPTTPPSLPTQIEHPADDLVVALRALGDATRLSLLRLVAETPRSTKELAQLLHMSEPGVSRHLSTLARAKLVRTKRDGYYVLYEVDTDALAPLADDLLGYIAAFDQRRDASA